MRRRPSVLLVSIFVHAVVLGLLATAPWWSPITNWPIPREVLAFTANPQLASLQDIELPRPPRARAADSPAPASSASPELAPIVSPTGVVPETARDGAAVGSPASGVEPAGTGTVDGVGVPAALPPPPPPPKPPEPIHAGGLVRPPAKIVHVAPQYPQIARASRVQGIVIIEATIDSHGNVESTTILRSIPLLDQAALDAVRQWKFTPTLLNGVAVPVIMTVTVNFELSQ
jgi:periplasmic protein TonB